jgi:hypothetical protein
MRDLYLKRNELSRKSQKLQTAKFDLSLTGDQVNELVRVQDEIYKRFKFYDEYLKIGGKLNARGKICIKER